MVFGGFLICKLGQGMPLGWFSSLFLGSFWMGSTNFSVSTASPMDFPCHASIMCKVWAFILVVAMSAMIYLGDSSVAWHTKGERTVKMVAFMKQMGFAVSPV